jgi:hypothetical protein
VIPEYTVEFTYTKSSGRGWGKGGLIMGGMEQKLFKGEFAVSWFPIFFKLKLGDPRNEETARVTSIVIVKHAKTSLI